MRVGTVISRALQFVLIGLFASTVFHGDHIAAGAALIAVILSFLPAMVKRNADITMPWIAEAFLTFAFVLHVAGFQYGLYEQYVWWDTLTHLTGSAVIGMLGFFTVFSFYKTGKIHITYVMAGAFIFLTTVAVGGLWEIVEFTMDNTLGTHNQADNVDTNTDLIWDTVAALIVAITGALYMSRSPEAKVEKNIEKLLARLER